MELLERRVTVAREVMLAPLESLAWQESRGKMEDRVAMDHMDH